MAKPAAPCGDMIEVEVAFARLDTQRLTVVRVPRGTPVREVLAQSGLPGLFPEIDPAGCPLGVFGSPVDDAYAPRAGDRVEVYRELRVDPREARRQRARKVPPERP
ncbi:MAG: RnfH family protein [Gammaproteobacteria bacterium]